MLPRTTASCKAKETATPSCQFHKGRLQIQVSGKVGFPSKARCGRPFRYRLRPSSPSADRCTSRPLRHSDRKLTSRGATKGHESQAIARLAPSLRARELLSPASSRRLIPGQSGASRRENETTPRANERDRLYGSNTVVKVLLEIAPCRPKTISVLHH